MMTPAADGAGLGKRHAPAASRNTPFIEAVLRKLLPSAGHVLEIASGTGQHAAAFARAFPHIVWQPSDLDSDNFASIAAWTMETGVSNLIPPRQFDAIQPWPNLGASFVGIVSINMIHIAPWAACEGLMKGAALCLRQGGFLLLYGPFKIDKSHTAPSNEAFDTYLKTMDIRYGVRDLVDVSTEAAANGLVLEEKIAMPANNFSIVFRRH